MCPNAFSGTSSVPRPFLSMQKGIMRLLQMLSLTYTVWQYLSQCQQQIIWQNFTYKGTITVATPAAARVIGTFLYPVR